MILLAPLREAWGFLTVLPGGARGTPPTRSSLWAYPVVGLALGAILLIATRGAVPVVGPRLAALAGVALLAILSGGLHLDGLADTADAVGCAKPRERRLEILRDPATGAFGVVAVVLVLLAKWEGMASLLPGERAVGWLLLPVAGRCAQVASCGALPYARAEGGLGARAIGDAGTPEILWGAGILLLAGVVAAGRDGGRAAAAALAAAAVVGFVCRARLGGATGDTVGAAGEIAEAAFAVALAAAGPGGWGIDGA